MSAGASPVLRFAPSPNGRLHLGHALSALLNARMAARLGGRLLLRIEDIDPVRSRPELIEGIEEDLAWLGLRFAGATLRQSTRMEAYAEARDGLAASGLAYPCFCSRAVVAAAAGEGPPRDPDGSPLYPGTCRALPPETRARRLAAGEAHVWRLDMARALEHAPGPHRIRVFDPDGCEEERDADPGRWGDAVIARRDVPTSYHLAVVLDDAAQEVSHVVRGADLEAATDLHRLLQTLLGLDAPAYHHHPLVRGEDGEKLAKSRNAPALATLRAAGATPAELRARLGFE
ncbi:MULTISPECIES: tRNA glutamyl-Q(34) synthetase GluQRS [Methylobacterium]|uniref:Glutamyl-Q tRNA(Asp) synthetase n=1 Tax=Methylobacterium jeotgali TaxID=381630 RepID=A0ABQ4T1I3_9HYPH|nr:MULTISPECIES: tRNA glutamyl-Q(34) synthetase GluQRS [Methylobacterium]PIU06791.1 MAG: tRNA glutamyl-Q(34) synthetase GluQRS [Methylobacterium sp. CG09_land_8_20_14_0_10_71_15]PIU11980.1 MAG: tRNA glutamyl-Q(34) synthetase GluQRS [Methylobacterium sp. CG08_land_8_20_14_0_20_71_15]GJE08887.1 Glutamyl-Q tRNA(Asp) synthetase [Methylobacterium jeotgali]